MKIKLRRFVSILSAMVLMICCAVPAFADDTVDKNDLSKVKWSFVDSPLKIPHFQEVYDNYKSIISNTYNYIAVYGKKSDGTSETNILYFDPTAISYYSFTNNQFLFGSNYAYDSQRLLFSFDLSDKNIGKGGYGGWNVTKPNGFLKSECRALINLNDYVQSTVKVYFHTKVYDFDNIENELEPPDPNAPVVPFSVQYSRKLTTGMSRSGTLSAPGAKNDGETITNNTIDVTVKLTDEYKQAMHKALEKDPKASQYTYQYVLFITPYDPNIFGTKKAMDGAIYTYLNKSKYVLSTAYGKTKSNTTTNSKYDTVSTPDNSSTDTSSENVGEMTSENADGVANSAYCTGVTPLFGLPIAINQNMTNTHKINLENIKGADKLGEQDILYIVVVGKRYLYETGAEGYAKDFYANNAEFKTFYKELPDNAVASKINGLYGGNGYDFYTVVSDGFSFKDYPDYKPLEIDGVEYPTDKSISDMLNDPFSPSKITDYDGLENGTDFDTKEDFDDYIRNKTYDEEFGSFSFNLSDISSIFDSTSDFFKFLTASIGLLPSIFITVLIAFFTIMLGICVVKWAIK